ncbi:HtaA domain-containing protein [Glycomyces xiaoerkulensis]|uniref:HtaA domain-containing protein n=1 Tax=Glycomyces xiaoerkulensis TaxID=2038139 RepID=UPI0018E4335C|nr:HtaA domain-containing protein [Glycomyces xiaoerkulensis]
MTATVATSPVWTAPANADEASGGRLDWGVKESFRGYITGPIAQGEVTTGDGASTVGGAYRFHSAAGEYDPESGTASIAYSGWVHFRGHDGELDVTFADPSIEYTGDEGILYVHVNGTRTDLAALSGPSITGVSGTLAVEGASASLTANGSEAFAGYYEAGEALDPVSFTADLVAPGPEPEAPTPSGEAPEAEPTGKAGIGRGVLDWGVRTSWRDYVSGDIAAGSWEATGGALDGGAVFRFVDGEGRTDGDDFELAFRGAVTFTGTDLDLTIADPTVTAADGQGVLSATIDGERTDLVGFEAELSEQGDLLVAQDVPTVLTTEAVDVFAGFYQAGSEMDPLSIAVPLTSDAELPALPDLGSEPEASPSTVETDTASTESGTNPLIRIAPAAAALLLAAAAAMLAVHRRRRSRAAAAAARTEPTDPPEAASTEDDGGRQTPEASSTDDPATTKE